MSGEVWTQLYDRLAQLVSSTAPRWCSSNTRDSERIARHLSERLGEQHVTRPRSMAKNRGWTGGALKRGELRALCHRVAGAPHDIHRRDDLENV